MSFETFLDRIKCLEPRVALVLGSGLGNIPHAFAPEAGVSFGEVPGLVQTTVSGHSGSIEVGLCVGVPLLLFRGRLHYYEGHPWERVRRPVELAAEWGVRTLFLTNAAGGIHPDLEPGSLMVLEDHLYLQSPGSWKGPGPAGCKLLAGERPSPYSERLRKRLQDLEVQQGRALLAGIYAALTGPCYETPSEILALRAMGVDAVGMSTAVEAETAHRLGIECAAISCITNKAAGLAGKPLDHHEVLETAKQVVQRVSGLFERWLSAMEP